MRSGFEAIISFRETYLRNFEKVYLLILDPYRFHYFEYVILMMESDLPGEIIL